MEASTAFDKCVRMNSLGVRHAPGSLPPQVATEYDRYLYRVRSFVDSARSRMPRLPPVYADFVQNPLFDARAFRVNGLHLIVIYGGMPVVTTAVVRRMLADRRLLRHAGDPSLEADNLPLYVRITPNANELLKTITVTSPKDDRRVIYSHHLQNTVFDFLAAHELTHIAHGHVRYMSPERDQPVPSEDRWMPRTPEGNLESQTMEMDADFNAAKLMMQHIDRLWKEHATLPPPLNEYYADRTRAVYDIAAAINIMCRLFGDKAFTGVDLDRSRHPPMAWRQMWTLNTLGNYVEHLWGEELVKPGEEAINKALYDVEMAFAVITGSIMSVAGLEEAFGPIGRAYGKKLSDCWNDSLKGKLAKHSSIDGPMPHYGFDFGSALSQVP